jgi:trimethylamine--corrinoid protein Co-methyltransferase
MYEARLTVWDEPELERVHGAVLEVLSRVGVEVRHPPALDLLTKAGATVDGSRVRIGAKLVAECLDSVPRSWVVESRGADAQIVLADGAGPYYGSGPDCIYTRDPDTGERRRGGLRDVEELAAFQEKLPDIDFVMSMVLPVDADSDISQFAAMLAGTRKPIVMSSAQSGEHLRPMQEMARMCGEANSLMCLTMSSAPLSHDADALSKVMVAAELGIPLISASAPSAGATAPCSVTSALVTGLAETLSALVVHQLARPGAPFVSGAGMAVLDLRLATDPYVTPECFLGMQAAADMARHYGIPSWSYSGVTDSKVLDEQQALDSALSTVLGSLSRATLLHDVGYMESGLQSSHEAILLGHELVAFARSFMREVPVTAEALAIDEIVAVGPGGNYLGRPLTRRNYRSFWKSELFDHQVHDRWAVDGATTMGERIRRHVAEVRSQPKAFELSADVHRRIDKLCAEAEELYIATRA